MLSSGVFLPYGTFFALILDDSLNLHESPGRKVLRKVQLSINRLRMRAVIIFAVEVAS